MWQAINEIKVDLAEVKGRVAIILLVVSAIFISVVSLLFAQLS